MRLSLKHLVLPLAATATLLVSGCSTMHTVSHKQDLKVTTKMSETIFLEPVSPSKQTIYVKLRNTSDRSLEELDGRLRGALLSRGYTIVNDPEQAQFMLQANILYVGETDGKSAESIADAGFGGAILGGLTGAATSKHGEGAATGALVGAAVGLLADAMVSDVFYTVVADLQIRERPAAGERVTQTQEYRDTQGGSTTEQYIEGAQVRWKSYNARAVTTATQMNLTFEEARGSIVSDLVRAIGGVF